MATGTVTLFWYVACCGLCLFVGGVATGLVIWGQRKDRKRREARRLAAEGSESHDRDAAPSRVDPDPPAR